ncbi:MAG: SgcJ/EcaC family oxidoreductase [Hamadaea sp.]|nr:SgcJ/EcaC family oxidoreductase [Hamadaea sp.]NUR52611.1 SgcJ/EcaC family oxidoreductase [Hamadaea sp.]NUT02609.1 SgcJ/EcaC family oxidoreductase [Hamadaea sp.]
MTTTTVATDEAAIRSVLGRMYEAWSAHDADAFADLYTADATVVMPGLLNDGREAIREFMAAAFAGRLAGTQGVDVPQKIRITGDTAIVVSHAGTLMPGETTLAAERERHATWVFVREGGDWKIAAYANAPVHL